ncbi:MAG: hypothetical protein K2X49_24870 [Acetobacteraceae bacterium]|nr:hypothetical protein [Acetobacteraceae bacterium]
MERIALFRRPWSPSPIGAGRRVLGRWRASSLRQIEAGLTEVKAGVGRLEDKADAQTSALLALREEIAREKGVNPEVLWPIFERRGEMRLGPDEMRRRAGEAVATILDHARQREAPSNDADTAAARDWLHAALERDALRQNRRKR